ncbi:MAG: histidine phosphatase family protein, partial [Leptospiraceae bacterium]|nr:histidine phosphatase family protein [Leptospiraceae bacterium]
TSPSLRCKQLSSYLRKEDFFEDSRLLEINFGDWEGKKWEEIPQKEIEPWYNDFVNVKVPSGESFQELYTRVVDCFKNSNFTQNQVWITHAGVIRSVICEVLGLDLKNAFRLEIDYGSASVFQRKYESWVLKQLGIF